MARFFAMLLLMSPVLAHAQIDEGGLSMVLFQALPSGTFRWERWSEATVRLKNERPAAFEGRLVVDFPSAPKEGAMLAYSRPVTLPARSLVEVNLMVRFPPASARPLGKENLLPVRLRLMRGPTCPAQDIFPCAVQSEEGPPIAWMDVGESRLPYRLKKQAREAGKKGASAEAGRRAYAIEVVPPNRFPRRATGLDAYDAVVLSRWDARQRLDALQTEALIAWVKGGGRLLALAGAHWNDLPNPALAALLPLRPTERTRTSWLPALAAAFGDLGIEEGVDVYDGDRAPARLLLGDKQQPFLLERRIGLGAAFFLTLDVDRMQGAESPGMERLIRRALAETARGAATPMFANPAKAREVVENLVAVKILPRGKMALWLGGYVALVATALAGARTLRRAEYGYLAAALAAVAVALILHGMSRAMRRGGGEAVERVRAYIAESGPGDASVRIEGLEGFFPVKERRFVERLGLYHALIEPSVSGAARAEVIEFATDDLAGVGAWTLQPNTVRALRFDAHFERKAPPIAWSARLTRDGLLAKVASSLEDPLAGAFLKWNRFVAPLGALKTGEPHEIETWKLGDRLGRYETSNLRGRWTRVEGMLRQMTYPDFRARLGQSESLQALLQQANAVAIRPVVVGGFSRVSPAIWEKGADDVSGVVGMWLVRGDEETLEADREFLLPKGLARLALEGKTGRISHLGGGEFSGNGEEEILVSFRPPPPLRGAAYHEARVHGAFDSLHFSAKVEAGWSNGTVEPTTWRPIEWPAAGGAPVLDPQAGQDTLWVRLAVRRSGSAAAGNLAAVSTLQRWNLRGLDYSALGSQPPADSK
ncbi:MAG: hypothetical protein IT578_11625 [Verrucomicrobiae bacterium]|nr:hypothetical protein [Verrucomicrobiae bacterium]